MTALIGYVILSIMVIGFIVAIYIVAQRKAKSEYEAKQREKENEILEKLKSVSYPDTTDVNDKLSKGNY